jgi:hypothetical protein
MKLPATLIGGKNYEEDDESVALGEHCRRRRDGRLGNI